MGKKSTQVKFRMSPKFSHKIVLLKWPIMISLIAPRTKAFLNIKYMYVLHKGTKLFNSLIRIKIQTLTTHSVDNR